MMTRMMKRVVPGMAASIGRMRRNTPTKAREVIREISISFISSRALRALLFFSSYSIITMDCSR